ncbi:MAG: DNA repair protein RecO [Lachnospiraceae bacterium]|nr:DNA repair protein RecO [Lachnospiraceae bacterium]
MVLFQSAVGENDKRLVILTKEKGKITVFARGARRPGNANLAVGPFSTGEFEVIEGRSAYNLKRSVISNYFRELATDPKQAYYGFYFLEACGFYAVENADESNLINLLYITLRAMERKQMDMELLRRVFELKLLAIEGEYPNVFECVSCGSKENLNTFSFEGRGMVCDDCKRKTDTTTVSKSTLYTLQYVITSEPSSVYAFNVNDEVKEEFIYIVGKYFNMYVGHSFKSLEVLESMGLK